MKRKPAHQTGKAIATVTRLCMMAIAMASVGASSAYAATQATYYISPTGSDASAGDAAHPFQTLAKAQQVVRTINTSMTGDIVVYLMDGTYPLSSTFQLSESATVHDSGTNGYNIIYRAYPGAHPVISGGTTLGSWSVYDTNKNIYRSYVGQSNGILQMYVNGVRATVARGENRPSGFSVNITPYLVVDAFKVYNGANVTTVNDTDPGITYTGSWTYGSNRTGDISTDAHYSFYNGDSAAYTFTGTGIDLIVEKNTGYSAAIQIYIDGVLDQTVSSRGAQAAQQTVYSKSGLTSGSHTINLVNVPPTISTTNSKYSNMSSWRNPNQIMIVSESNWSEQVCSFSSVSGGDITLKAPGVNDGCGTNIAWIENAYELLSTPGQFYYDISDGYMYYVPRAYENLSTASVVAPQVEQLVNGTGAAGTPLHNIQFIGLAFEYGTWLQPLTNQGVPGNQANYFCITPVPPGGGCNVVTGNQKMGGNVVFNRASNIVIQANTFSHLGATGLVFENESQQNTVIGNSFSDISAGAIHVGDTYDFANTTTALQSINNTVRDNYLSTTGMDFRGAVGLYGGYNANLQLLHNELDHMPYSGISVGWGWGQDSSTPYSKNNVVSNNKVSSTMERMTDGGSIYLLGTQPGSVISGNFVTGMYHPYGALYLDNGTVSTNVNNNVVQNYVPYWLLVQQYAPVAYNNTVTNNYTENSSTTGTPTGNGNTLTNTTVITPGSWPSAALSIANSAGLEAGYAQLRNPVGVMVNDNQSGITYTGTWTYDSNRQASGVFDYRNDAHYTSTSGDSLQYSFTGTGIDVIAEMSPSFTSNALVYIDSVLQSTITTSSSNSLEGQTVYSIGGLSTGSHTIQIVNNASSSLVVDGFKVYNSIVPVAVTGVSLSQSQIAMNAGDTLDLNPSVTVSPSTATNGQIVWTSSNPAAATVAGGVVTAIYAGTAVITGTTLDGGFTASTTVTVSNVAVTGVALNPNQVSTRIGQARDLNPNLVFSPSNATNRHVTWSSGNTSIATVSNGVVTGVALGSAVITATTVDGNFTATATVTVTTNSSTSRIEAESYDSENSVQIQSGGSGSIVGNIQNGSWVAYNNIDFGTGNVEFLANLSVYSQYAGNQLQLRLDSPTGTLIGTLTTAGTGTNWTTFTNQTCPVSGVSGVHNLYIVAAAAAGTYVANIDWFTFKNTAASTSTIQAENFDSYNNVQIQSGGTGQIVGFIQNGSWMAYNNIDFGTGNTEFVASISVYPQYAGGQLQLRLDSPTGTLIGTLTTASTGSWTTFTNQTCAVSGVSGVHNLYIVASSSSPYVANIDWFTFQNTTPSTNTYQAENFSSYNSVQVQSGGTGSIVGYIQNGSWMAYSNIDFGTGNTEFVASISVYPSYAGGQLQLRLDSPTGTLIGTLTTTSTGGWTNFENQRCAVSGVSGVHNLYIVASGSAGTYIANIDWFTFQNSTPSTSTLQAENFDSYNSVQIQSGGTGAIVGNIQNGSWVAYNNINFGTGNTQFVANVSVYPSYAGNQLQLRLDSPTGTLIGTLTTASTGSWATFTNQTCAVSGASGVHTLYIVASSSAPYVANIDWFQFQ